MTEEEIEFVAEELAKVGGVSWYPGRGNGAMARVVTDRFRDRARVAIAAMERFRATRGIQIQSPPQQDDSGEVEAVERAPVCLLKREVAEGAIVVYRPPGDRRAYTCSVERIEGDHAILVPLISSVSFRVPLEGAPADGEG